MIAPRCLQLSAVAAIAALAACASVHQLPRSTLLTERKPPKGRQCWPAPDPAQLPQAAQLIDADAFRADARSAWEKAGKPRGYVLISIRHSLDGAQVRRAVLESTVPASLADSLDRLVFAYRRDMPPARAEWGVRLRVDLGDAPALRVGRREECTPAPRDWEYRTAGAPFDVREGDSFGMANPSLTDASLVWVRVRLDARGFVTDASVERSLRRGMWEARLLDYVRTMVFYPAVEDGYPVPGETSIPVRLSMTR